MTNEEEEYKRGYRIGYEFGKQFGSFSKEEGAKESQALALAWMKRHDILLNWVTSDADMLRRYMATGLSATPFPKYPLLPREE